MKSACIPLAAVLLLAGLAVAAGPASGGSACEGLCGYGPCMVAPGCTFAPVSWSAASCRGPEGCPVPCCPYAAVVAFVARGWTDPPLVACSTTGANPVAVNAIGMCVVAFGDPYARDGCGPWTVTATGRGVLTGVTASETRSISPC